jgi:autotransporter-associated beta strand protein
MLLWAGRIGAQISTANVTLAVNTAQAAAAAIPGDFSGLSFEMGSVIYDSVNQGWYLSGTNANMVALMKTLGVKSIRVGGNSAETGNIATNADEDAVLDFCHAIGGNLIWDLEIDGTLYDPPGKAAIAQSMQNYVNVNNYGSNILVFQVGNEPDLMPDPNNPGHNMGVTTYDLEFSNYIAAVNGLYSGSRWAGPDTAGGGTGFSATFCPKFAPGGQIAFVCQHDYPFGTSLDTNTSAVHVSWMLAVGNEAGYQSFNNQWVPPAFAAGLAPRYEECNSFFHNGSFGASDAYASALWGLGWMYFHANAGLAGVNFHMGLNANNPAYSAITPANLTANYTVHPLAYAIAAFNLGGHGKIVPVTSGNPSSANVVAYSVLQNDGSLMLTVINREYVSQPSPPAHNAALTISTSGTTYNDGQVMFLTGMNNDPSTTTGVTLGGSAISGSGVWTGTYLGMARPSGSSFALTVPTAQAAIIHLFNAAGPAAPTNLTATIGNSQVTLNWSNSPGATGYIVQRSSTTGGPYATIVSGVTTNSYTDTGLTNGLIYYYVVAATNSSGIGPQSAEAVAVLANLPPLTPTGLAAVPGDSVVALNWNASVGATNYILLISTNSDGSNSNLVSTLNTNYLNLGLNNGTTYYYAISAVGPYGQSSPSALVGVTPFVSDGIVWTNTITASAQSWNVNANWSGNAFPNATQAVALVNSPIAANQTINLNQSVIIGELNIGASGGAAAFNVAANGGTITFDNTPGTASVTQLASSKGDTISAPLDLNGSLNLYNTSANPLTIYGNITGTNNLLVNSGLVVLGGTTTYAGTTTVAQGTLQIASPLALQNSILNYNSGSLTFGGGISAATLGGLSGSQNLSLTNTVSAALALTVGANNLNTTYTGALTGSGSLTKSGTGTLTLTGTNNFTGNTTVLGGNLTVGGETFGSSGSTILVGNGATGVSFNVTNGTVTAGSLNVAPNAGSTGDNASITGTA